MKIDSYTANVSASHTYQKVTYSARKTLIWAGQKPEEAEKSESGKPAEEEALVSAAGNEQESQRKPIQFSQPKIWEPASSNLGRIATDENELRMNLLDELFYALTGKRFRLREIRMDTEQQNAPGLARFSGGFGIEHSREDFYYEQETMSYAAQASVRTADGRSIDVSLQLNMSREFMQYSKETMSIEYQPVDPLVINYGGTAASLSTNKFEFDLDADGVLDNISFAGAGSGFLALDKGGDGVINDGRELFGPATGNGFGELRLYDEDGNGWIDENDSIWEKLRVWSKDERGNDVLYTLAQVDVGAIFLGDVSTQFSLNDTQNNTHGQIRSTSFFLKESGGAGTVQHVDLSV